MGKTRERLKVVKTKVYVGLVVLLVFLLGYGGICGFIIGKLLGNCYVGVVLGIITGGIIGICISIDVLLSKPPKEFVEKKRKELSEDVDINC